MQSEKTSCIVSRGATAIFKLHSGLQEEGRTQIKGSGTEWEEVQSQDWKESLTVWGVFLTPRLICPPGPLLQQLATPKANATSRGPLHPARPTAPHQPQAQARLFSRQPPEWVLEVCWSLSSLPGLGFTKTFQTKLRV